MSFEVSGHHIVGDIPDLVAGGVHHIEDALEEFLFSRGQGGGVEDLDAQFGGGEEAAEVVVEFRGDAFAFEVLAFEVGIEDLLVCFFELGILPAHLHVIVSKDAGRDGEGAVNV